MPLPSSPKAKDAIIPEKFDENYNCGAYLRRTNSLCMLRAGQDTDHFGEGRCKFHGGQTPIRKDGSKSIVRSRQMVTLQTLFDKHANSPNLLRLDNEIAQLKSYVEMRYTMMAQNGPQYAQVYENFMNMAAEQNLSPQEITQGLQLILPDLDMGTYDTLARLTKTQYDMQFSRKFAVSIKEFETAMESVYRIIVKLADKHKLPRAFLVDLAEDLRKVKVSRPFDPTLEAAGADREPTIIDQED